LSELHRSLGIQSTDEDWKTVLEVIVFLRKKDITVDRASKILSDAQIYIPLITKL